MLETHPVRSEINRNAAGIADDKVVQVHEKVRVGIAAYTGARNEAGYDVAVLHMISKASAPELRTELLKKE
ncbi:hypothetical protein EST38_g8746 [Candolleomyces aberdarensis]|uniref:Uncharacterized protein n=1 Tax=Candolleomyces aberdarensis TaxID=2316362 RepID=A0A4Q2DDW2_9AGAR|nr:hypothetical protein EST38_g8746 [Candolleomyces aberdarensis]